MVAQASIPERSEWSTLFFMPVPEQILGVVTERLHDRTTVKSAYGDPIQVEGRTVVPIATVLNMFGGGGGSGPSRAGGEQRGIELGHGGGGGGGLIVKPKGYIEITGRSSRYVPLNNNRA